MQKSKRTRFVVVTMLAILLNLLMSCVTTKVETEYVYPEISFPIFPDPIDVQYDNKTNTVSMPLSYWLLITDYKIDVDAIADYFKRLKEIDNKEGTND